MIKEKTVFVFGAGLSSDYGFPLGSNLRDKVIELLNRTKPLESIPILKEMSYTPDEIVEVRNQLARGGFDTVDDFLEKRKNNLRHRSLAKTAVAMAIMQCENPNIFETGTSTTDFYRFLFKKMREGTDKQTFADNKVTIITYNYDRSFEQFLSSSLQHFYNIPLPEVGAIMSKIKIIHVHGMLGKMWWQDITHRIYSNKLDYDSVVLASEGIVNFDDVDETTAVYNEACEALRAAVNIIFVGFGFHNLNLSRLIKLSFLDNVTNTPFPNATRIKGTALNVTKTEMKEIEKITEYRLNDANLIDMKAAPFANEHLNWL